MNTPAKTVTGSAGGTESPTHGVNPGRKNTLQPLTSPPVGSVGTEKHPLPQAPAHTAPSPSGVVTPKELRAWFTRLNRKYKAMLAEKDHYLPLRPSQSRRSG